MSTVADFDTRELRDAFGCFPSGVAALCGLEGDVPVGMAVSSFTSVSIDPPLVCAFIQNSSTTWPNLRVLPRLGVTVLAEHQSAAGRTLAMKVGDRFAGVAWRADAAGAVVIDGASAWFDCSVSAEIAAGDHTMVLLAIHAFEVAEASPLVFHGSRFRRLHLVDETESM